MQGVLLVDKPSGWTSFDVVNYVRRAVARVQGTKPRTPKLATPVHWTRWPPAFSAFDRQRLHLAGQPICPSTIKPTTSH